MSSIMMHVLPSNTHPLTLSPGPIRDISVHASIAACNTTLDNSNHSVRNMFLDIQYPSQRAICPSKYCIHRSARYDPQNATSSLNSYTFSMHITFVTTISQNNANDMFTKHKEMAIFITLHNTQQDQQQFNKPSKPFPLSTHHTQSINYIAFYNFFFNIRINHCGQFNLSLSHITPRHISQGNTHISYT